MTSWAFVDYEREMRQALIQGLVVGFSEANDGHVVLHVLIPMSMRLGAITLRQESENRCAVIHRSPKPLYKPWQLTYFVGPIMAGDACFEEAQDALDHGRGLGLIVEEVRSL